MEMVSAGQVVCLLFKVLSCPAFWDLVAGVLAVCNPGQRAVALPFPVQPSCLVLCCCSASLVQGPYHTPPILDVFSLLPCAKQNEMFLFSRCCFSPHLLLWRFWGFFFLFFGLYCWNIYFLSCFYFEKGNRSHIPLRCY